MNYIETPDGVKRPFRFSWLALLRLAKELNIEKLQGLVAGVTDLPLSKVSTFCLIGFEHGAKREKIEVDFKEADVANWLDDDFSIFTRAMEIFARDFNVGADEGNASEAKGKK